MKIKLTEQMKRHITMAEMPALGVIRDSVRHDDGKIDFSDEVRMTMELIAPGENFEILKLEAEFAKNCRIRNYYGYTDCDGNVAEGKDSFDLDVWISIYAFSSYAGFYVVGAYLSDIWQIGPREMRDELLSRMYIRHFKEVK